MHARASGVLWTLLLGAGPTTPESSTDDGGAVVDPVARLRLQLGQAAVARARLAPQIADAPDDAGLASLYGEASAQNGNYVDALLAFATGQTSTAYGIDAMRSHADVLRVLGEPGEAVSLRTQIIAADPSPQRTLEAYLDLVDDHRADGDLSAAWDAAMMALSIGPDRGAPYAQLAEVLMDLGSWDEAMPWIDLAALIGPRSTYLVRAEVRAAVHAGRFVEARTLALNATQEDRNDLELRALRADAITASGDPKTSLSLLQLKRFEGVDHPQMLLAELHALQAMGATEAASALGDDIRALYGRSVLNALGLMEQP
jgi:tetratricopeptide (TPR) repeat protein